MSLDGARLQTFAEVLLQEIRDRRPDLLQARFTIAEVYQVLVPYRTHRDRLGLEIIGDYDETLLRLLIGEGGFLKLEPASVRERLAVELEARNPNPGVYRTFAAAEVELGAAALALGLPQEEAPAQVDAPPVATPPVVTPKVATQEAVVPPPEGAKSLEGEAGSDLSAGLVDPESQAPAQRTEEDKHPSCPSTSCGKPLPAHPNLAFCPYCGVNLLVRSCARCDEPLESDWRFCVQCGAPAGSP